MRSAALPVIIVTLIASAAQAEPQPHKRGTTRGRSHESAIAACAVAKQKANALYCAGSAIEKDVSSCQCTEAGGQWTCEVSYLEVCREKDFGKGSYAWTGTFAGESKRTMKDACYAAEIENRRVACPENTLARELDSCECEWLEKEGKWSCLMDQTLWCHG